MESRNCPNIRRWITVIKDAKNLYCAFFFRFWKNCTVPNVNRENTSNSNYRFFEITFRMAEALDEQTTKELLIWIDSIELSRPKKNINRDFADGVLVAEVIHVSTGLIHLSAWP